MILNICSFPRSGNSRFTTGIRYSSDWEFNGKQMSYRGTPGMYVGGDCFDLSKYTGQDTIYAVKTHGIPQLPPSGSMRKSIYIIRDGRDCAVSYAHMQSERNPGTYLDWLTEWVTGMQWANHIESVLPHCDTVIRYEDMNQETIWNALKVCGITCKPGWIQTYDELKNRYGGGDGGFYRRGIAGSHKDEMPQHLIDLFNQGYRLALQRFQYL